MDLGIRGRRAIVCASSRGLGRACAFSLGRAGVDLVVNGRDERKLEETAEEIRRETGVNVTTVAADISSPNGQAAVLAACPDPDILINNNGGPPFRDYRELDREAMLEGVTMNMVTPIELIQKVMGPMQERKFGRIVNITSVSVKMPIPGLDLSSGARAGLTAFLAGVCRTVAQDNVTINAVLPGFIDTNRMLNGIASIARLQNRPLEEVTAEREAAVPAKRFGNAEEFGEVCAFLCSVQAAYITGQSLLVDGGLYNGAF